MRGWMLLFAAVATACGQYTAKATVTVAVSGPGAVRSSGLQGDCRGTCWFSVPRDTPVHLEPVIDGEATFAGWSGACGGTGACDLAPGVDVSVAATFMAAKPRRLQVSLNGAGTVRSDPAGIDCPRTCAADFPPGTAVRLDASAPDGWDFTGFGGACSGPACALTLSDDVSAWATFVQRPANLAVQLTGSGSVTSSPAGIDCPRVCSATFAGGSNVTLTATPAAGFNFSAFSGACSGGSCSLQLAGNIRVEAAFAALPTFKVVVVVGGMGRGRVTSAPAGIDCPGSCEARFADGTAVALSASPDALSKFSRWSGSCSGAGCSLSLTADAAVGAEFEQRRYVAMDLGTTPGNWWSLPAGISPHGTLVTGKSGGYPLQAFLWDGAMHAIGPSGGEPVAVNDSGMVVGNYPSTSGYWRAFRWQDGAMVDLATLGGSSSWAYGMNGDGVVVGSAWRADSVGRAVSWDSKGTVVDLGSLGGAWNGCSSAYGINSKGVTVGQSCSDSGNRPVRFREPGIIDDLGTFGGTWGQAQAINDAGVIVGSASFANGVYHGFMYADGKLNDAGSVPGLTYSQLMAVNGSSVAVGTAFDGAQRAVIYGAGRMVDLNTLVDGTPYTLVIANGIDESGNIVVQGSDRGTWRVLLLRPR